MSRSLKKLALFVLGIGILALSAQGAFAQTLDFFSNTQNLDQRTNGTNGAPGFNPCVGGTTVNSTTCSGAPSSAPPLLDPANLGVSGIGPAATAGLFEKTGPGAITDNMFGIVERPANPLVCGSQGAGVLSGGSGAIGSTGTLNCGDGKFDQTLQGQTIPTAGSNLAGAMAVNTPMDMTSCTAGKDPTTCAGDASMVRTQLENAFVWNPTGTGVLIPINTANMPTIVSTPAAKTCAAAASANFPAVCSQQSLLQTTALGTSTTSVVALSTDFATTNDATGVMQAPPTVNWESHIVQSEMVGGGTFDQTLSGSFVYNQNTTFATTAYPNGQSMTINSNPGSGTPIQGIP